jgi:hypothetical protein
VEAGFSPKSHELAAGVDQDKAIFPSRTAFFFGSDLEWRIAREVSLQTVHQGEAVLRVVPSGSQYEHVPPLEVRLQVRQPARLGDANNGYDATIATVAHAYGIPPQVIKAQVEQESHFNERSYRYEARDWDANLLSDDEFANIPELAIFAAVPHPRCKLAHCGSALTPQVLQPRTRYQRLEYNVKHPDAVIPWTCYALTDDPNGSPSLWQVVEGSDGWAPCSPPWLKLNPDDGCPTSPQGEIFKGACGQREGWWVKEETGWLTYDHWEKKFWCKAKNGQFVDCTDTREAKWLRFAAPSHRAQTVVAASYGLLQIWYYTALKDMGWREGQEPVSKNPLDLFDPLENLNLGTGYLTKMLRLKAMGEKSEKLYPSREKFEADLRRALGHYNAGPGRFSAQYVQEVWARVGRYRPSL